MATPTLLDPNFLRTVVLMLEHGPQGALGIVLNRPSGLTVAEALTAWVDVAAPPTVLFVGGPVQPDGVIGLVDLRGTQEEDVTPAGPSLLWPGVGTVDLAAGPAALGALVDTGASTTRLRAFAGYAGWGPLQLEGELAAHSWFVVDREDDDAWTGAPQALWTAVLRRQPGRIAQFAHCPIDPAQN